MALTDAAIAKIKMMIVDGELRPGDRLPPEKELAERLGLSRNSMREAVKALEVMHVLDVRRGDGTYVTSLSPSVLLDAFSFVIDMQGDEGLLEVLAVRRVLEAHAARLAAQRAAPADIDELRAELERVDSHTEIAELIDHDRRFHRQISAIAGNAYLAGLIENLSGRTVRARVWRGLTQSDAVGRTIDEHRGIAAAIADGDADLAHARASAHVAGVESWLRDTARGGRPL